MYQIGATQLGVLDKNNKTVYALKGMKKMIKISL